MDADARTFGIQIQVDAPEDGMVISVDDNADYPYTVEKIHYRIDDGECTIQPTIDGVPIDGDQSDSDGKITVDSPSGSDSFTDSSYDLVPEGGALLMTINDVESSTAGPLRVKFTCRRTLVNVDPRSDEV